jgi:hypothetical protein
MFKATGVQSERCSTQTVFKANDVPTLDRRASFETKRVPDMQKKTTPCFGCYPSHPSNNAELKLKQTCR